MGINASGFSAMLGGISYQGAFQSSSTYASFWSSTNYDTLNALNFELIYNDGYMIGGVGSKMVGSSIRCLNDLSLAELPVELTGFTASVKDYNIILKWNTATEVNSASFNIEKKPLIDNNWQIIASVKASGNSSSPKIYSYIDKNIISGKYNYRLKMVDQNGSYKYSEIVYIEAAIPTKFELSDAFPNPWNPTTTIRYQLPTNSLVTIKIFDALGKEITTLVNEIKPAGNYSLILNSKNLSSGVYYYQMIAGNFIETKKIILLK